MYLIKLVSNASNNFFEDFCYDMDVKLIQNRKPILILISSTAVICLIIFLIIFINSRFNPLPQIVASQMSSKERVEFPGIDESQLSEEKINMIRILKAEYIANPKGTKYSEGISEPWCADFVSWVFNQMGRPLKNPNSGSWRIPGTYTLREYYGSNYSPKVGDIMLYDNPSPFGQHTNIVIKNKNGVVTTIGGNEPGGIRIVEHTEKDKAGFIGYGLF
jgi:hypothetical protein